MEQLHSLYPRDANQPPPPMTKLEMNATLIVSWWCTIFSLIVILIRIMGRWIRTERLFREDKAMLWSIIPLMVRMAFVHPVLIWGTNNTETAGLSEQDIQNRAMGSRLVLGARIWYAVYIWAAKIAVLEFVRKIISASWTKLYRRGARVLYAFLALTLVAVIFATLVECRPFPHYWQVTPDPGPACRTGRAQLITMGTCDIISDVALIVFPIPLVMMSKMPLSKKVSLTLLFLLSIVLIAVTSYRMPSVIARNYSQQYRSLLASLEILAATCVSNGIVIGSFLRDKGVKKRKYRAGSTGYTDEEADGASLSRPATRTTKPSVAQRHWGSDEDLVRGLGLTVSHELRYHSAMVEPPRMDPLEEIAPDHQAPSPVITSTGPGLIDPSWTFRKASTGERQRRDSEASTDSDASSEFKMQEMEPYTDRKDVNPPPGPDSPYRKMSFFDVGGLVDLPQSEESSIQPMSRRTSAVPPTSRSGQNFIADIGGLLGGSDRNDEISPVQPASGFRASLSLLSPRKVSKDKSFFNRATVDEEEEMAEVRPTPRKKSSIAAPIPRHASGPDDLGFSDAGGLLN